MTNQWDYDEDENDEFEADEPRGGKNLVNDLRKQLKQKDKLLREQSEKLTELTKTTRTNTIKSFLQDKGVNTKLARYIPTDIEATDEALGAWLEEDGELFGIKLGEPEQKPEEQEDEEPFSAGDIERLKQITSSTQGGVIPAGKESDAIAAMHAFKSPEELTKFLESKGMQLNSHAAE